MLSYLKRLFRVEPAKAEPISPPQPWLKPTKPTKPMPRPGETWISADISLGPLRQIIRVRDVRDGSVLYSIEDTQTQQDERRRIGDFLTIYERFESTWTLEN